MVRKVVQLVVKPGYSGEGGRLRISPRILIPLILLQFKIMLKMDEDGQTDTVFPCIT